MTKIKDNFGIGLFQVPFYDKISYGHTGGIDEFSSMSSFFPKENISISYTSNGASMLMNDIMIGALSIYFGKEYTLPNFTVLDLKSEDLDQYLGVYSGSAFPLKITISKEDNVLIAQATGQPSFPLEAFKKNKFKYDKAMLEIEFLTSEDKLILKQGERFELTKE